MTKQKQLVLDIVKNSCEHLPAEAIYILAKKQMPSIAIGTVYRNLNSLADEGEIRRLEIPNAPDRFDKTVTAHEHMVCTRCGKLTDLRIENLKELIRAAAGEEPVSYHLCVSHICKDCRKQTQ